MSITHEQKLPLTKAEAQAIVTDLNTAYAKIDEALVHTLRTSAKMIETGRSMGLDPLKGQKIYLDMDRCATAMLESRSNLVAAHQKAHRARRVSMAWEEDLFGCPRRPEGTLKEGRVLQIVPESAVA